MYIWYENMQIRFLNALIILAPLSVLDFIFCFYHNTKLIYNINQGLLSHNGFIVPTILIILKAYEKKRLLSRNKYIENTIVPII